MTDEIPQINGDNNGSMSFFGKSDNEALTEVVTSEKAISNTAKDTEDDLELVEEIEEETGEEAEEEIEEEEEEGIEEEEEEKVDDKKALKAKTASGKELNIPLDAKITVPVDGELKEITIQEFANGISGAKAISQKFSEVDRKEKATAKREQDFFRHQRHVENTLELITSLPPMDAIQFMAHIQGKDGQELYKNIITQTLELVEKVNKIPVDQRAAYHEMQLYQAQRRIEEKRHALNQKVEAELSQEQLKEQNRVKTLARAAEMHVSKTEFVAALEDIASRIDKGEFKDQNVTEEDVLDYVRHKKVFDTVSKSVTLYVKSPSPEYLKRVQAAVEAEEKVSGKHLTEDQIKGLIKGYLRSDKKKLSENLSKKASSIPAKSETAKSLNFKTTQATQEEKERFARSYNLRNFT